MLKNSLKLFGCLVLATLLFSACKKDDDSITIKDEDSYTIPTAYSAFQNVSYSGQTQRLGMLKELKDYMKSANTPMTVLDAARMKAMYANDIATAQWAGTYEDSKQLKSKTFETEREKFDALLDALALASQSTVAGTNGQAGVVVSNNGEKRYLLGPDGIEYAQLVEKGLMGACFYYQATGVYMESERMNVDNETVTEGKGTKMEHHWDEAFGYLGVPQDFPTNTDGIVFWGTYSDRRNSILQCNKQLMDGFLKGRAAITNKDIPTRDEAISEVRPVWELVSVGSALHYLNDAMTDFDDIALRNHSLSEALAFIYALKFNPAKKITTSQIDELLTLIAGSSDFASMNLYDAVSEAKLLEARDKLAGYFDLNATKGDF